jgi:hypothetical protein
MGRRPPKTRPMITRQGASVASRSSERSNLWIWLVPPAGFEPALTAPEADPACGSDLAKHAAPGWLGGVWGAVPQLTRRQDRTRAGGRPGGTAAAERPGHRVERDQAAVGMLSGPHGSYPLMQENPASVDSSRPVPLVTSPLPSQGLLNQLLLISPWARSGRDGPLRPELRSGCLGDLSDAAAVWVHGEQVAGTRGWAVPEDDLGRVR